LLPFAPHDRVAALVTRPGASRFLYVVARDRPEIYTEFRESFLQSARLGIVLDRRGGPGSADAANSERRQLSVDESLRTRGWARVRIDSDGHAALA
jgi:hypothetical protein